MTTAAFQLSWSLAGELRVGRWFIWSLNRLLCLSPGKHLSIGLTVDGERAVQELLSAYARDVHRKNVMSVETNELINNGRRQ